MNSKKKSPTRSELDGLCRTQLDLSLEDLLLLIPKLEKLRKILDRDLSVQRFHGLMRSTNKEDVLDCSYVKMCVIEFLKNADKFKKLKKLIGD